MTIEQTQEPNPSPFATNDEWLAQYIFGSFYFSQGEVDLQRHIDNYAVHGFQQHFFDLWLDGSISQENPVILASTLDLITDYFARGKHAFYERDEAEAHIVDRFAHLHTLVHPDGSAEPAVYQKADNVYEILAGLEDREERYVLGRDVYKGEPVPEVIKRSTKAHPRYATSFLIDHLFDGAGARHPVFEQLFVDMRRVIVDDPDEHVERIQKTEDKIAELRRRPARRILELVQKLDV